MSRTSPLSAVGSAPISVVEYHAVNAAIRRGVPLKFCDLKCTYARFPREEAVDGARSCRTFAALYCEKKKAYVHKNMPCGEKVSKRERA